MVTQRVPIFSTARAALLFSLAPVKMTRYYWKFGQRLNFLFSFQSYKNHYRTIMFRPVFGEKRLSSSNLHKYWNTNFTRLLLHSSKSPFFILQKRSYEYFLKLISVITIPLLVNAHTRHSAGVRLSENRSGMLGDQNLSLRNQIKEHFHDI